MRVLFTSPILEHPPAGGPQLRIENSIKALSRVSDLYLVSRASKHQIGGKEGERFFRSICREMFYAPSVKKQLTNRYIRKLQILMGEMTGVDAKFILKIVDQFKIDVVWCGYGNISYPLIKKLKSLRPSLKVICDTDSVWSRFILRELPLVKNKLRRTLITIKGKKKEQEEKAWVELCDITTAVSLIDAEYYGSISSRPEKIRVFSNVIDLSSYEEIPKPPVNFKKPCIFLAGTFGHFNSPMDIAARWVVEDVFPKVKLVIPDIHFYIVGRGSDQTLSHLSSPSITVTGKLPSVLPYLCNADVSLVPLKFESGTRFKILEAAACRVPIVSTVLGAEGLPTINGEHILLADDPEDFAKSIIELIKDKRKAQSISNNCRLLVEKAYSVEHLEKEAKGILENI